MGPDARESLKHAPAGRLLVWSATASILGCVYLSPFVVAVVLGVFAGSILGIFVIPVALITMWKIVRYLRPDWPAFRSGALVLAAAVGAFVGLALGGSDSPPYLLLGGVALVWLVAQFTGRLASADERLLRLALVGAVCFALLATTYLMLGPAVYAAFHSRPAQNYQVSRQLTAAAVGALVIALAARRNWLTELAQ